MQQARRQPEDCVNLPRSELELRYSKHPFGCFSLRDAQEGGVFLLIIIILIFFNNLLCVSTFMQDQHS